MIEVHLAGLHLRMLTTALTFLTTVIFQLLKDVNRLDLDVVVLCVLLLLFELYI